MRSVSSSRTASRAPCCGSAAARIRAHTHQSGANVRWCASTRRHATTRLAGSCANPASASAASIARRSSSTCRRVTARSRSAGVTSPHIRNGARLHRHGRYEHGGSLRPRLGGPVRRVDEDGGRAQSGEQVGEPRQRAGVPGQRARRRPPPGAGRRRAPPARSPRRGQSATAVAVVGLEPHVRPPRRRATGATTGAPSSSHATRYRTSPRPGTSRTTGSTPAPSPRGSIGATGAGRVVQRARSTRRTGTPPRPRSTTGVPNRSNAETGGVASRSMGPTAARTAAFPEALDPVADRVEARIDALLDRASAGVGSQSTTALADPLDALREFVAAGGKRLRPAFCECAFVGAGGALDDPARDRRGRRARARAHVRARARRRHGRLRHPARPRRGAPSLRTAPRRRSLARSEPRRFGDGMAILVGDFAFVYADMLMRGAPDAAQAVFDELRVELCVGQSLDLVGTATARTDAASARRIATYKSGKYTVERPLHLGRRARRPLAELGRPALGDRAAAGRGVPAARRRARRVRREPRSPASPSATTSARASRRRSSRIATARADRRRPRAARTARDRPT